MVGCIEELLLEQALLVLHRGNGAHSKALPTYHNLFCNSGTHLQLYFQGEQKLQKDLIKVETI